MTVRKIGDSVIITNTPDYSSLRVEVFGPNRKQKSHEKQIVAVKIRK